MSSDASSSSELLDVLVLEGGEMSRVPCLEDGR